MSRAQTRAEHFRKCHADFSERFHANGSYEGYCDVPELFAPLLKQYKLGRARINELSGKPDINTEEKRERENLIRQCGGWAAELREGAQLAYERMFLIVAQARLPKEHFLTINEEARTVWRSLGFGDMPADGYRLKKAFRARKDISGHKTNVSPAPSLPECS